MSRIRGADTAPERIVRSRLHRLGFRFRLHAKNLPGRPDIVLPAHRAVVLVHGCFWHRHARCKYAYRPKSRSKFWKQKFRKNVLRDRRVLMELRSQGWRVQVVWECETSFPEALDGVLRAFLKGSTLGARSGEAHRRKRMTTSQRGAHG